MRANKAAIGVGAVALSVTAALIVDPHIQKWKDPVGFAEKELERALASGKGAEFMDKLDSYPPSARRVVMEKLEGKGTEDAARLAMNGAAKVADLPFAPAYFAALAEKHPGIAVECAGHLSTLPNGPVILAKAHLAYGASDRDVFLERMVPRLDEPVRREVLHLLIDRQRDEGSAASSPENRNATYVIRYAPELLKSEAGIAVLVRAAEFEPAGVKAVAPGITERQDFKACYEAGTAWREYASNPTPGHFSAVASRTSDAAIHRLAFRAVATSGAGASALVFPIADRLIRTVEGESTLLYAAAHDPVSAVQLGIRTANSGEYRDVALYAARFGRLKAPAELLVPLLEAGRSVGGEGRRFAGELLRECAENSLHLESKSAVEIALDQRIPIATRSELLAGWMRSYPNDSTAALLPHLKVIMTMPDRDELLTGIARHAPLGVIEAFPIHRSDRALSDAGYFLGACKQDFPIDSPDRNGLGVDRIRLIRKGESDWRTAVELVNRVFEQDHLTPERMLRDPSLRRLAEIDTGDLTFPSWVSPSQREKFAAPICRNLHAAGLDTGRAERQSALDQIFALRSGIGQQRTVGNAPVVLVAGFERFTDVREIPEDQVVALTATERNQFGRASEVARLKELSPSVAELRPNETGTSLLEIRRELRRAIVEAPAGTTFIFTEHGAPSVLGLAPSELLDGMREQSRRSSVFIPGAALYLHAADLAAAFKERERLHPEVASKDAAPVKLAFLNCHSQQIVGHFLRELGGKGGPMDIVFAAPFGQSAIATWNNGGEFMQFLKQKDGTFDAFFQHQISKGFAQWGVVLYRPGTKQPVQQIVRAESGAQPSAV